jgi:hypothetical protein
MAELIAPEVWESLRDSGAIPPEVRRMVIDVQLNQPVLVYYECFADTKVVEIIPDAISGGIAVSVNDVEGSDDG